jgi:hypothetical protein
LRSSLGQIGARSPAEARKATIRHPGAIDFETVAARVAAKQRSPKRSKR